MSKPFAAHRRALDGLPASRSAYPSSRPKPGRPRRRMTATAARRPDRLLGCADHPTVVAVRRREQGDGGDDLHLCVGESVRSSQVQGTVQFRVAPNALSPPPPGAISAAPRLPCSSACSSGPAASTSAATGNSSSVARPTHVPSSSALARRMRRPGPASVGQTLRTCRRAAAAAGSARVVDMGQGRDQPDPRVRGTVLGSDEVECGADRSNSPRRSSTTPRAARSCAEELTVSGPLGVEERVVAVAGIDPPPGRSGVQRPVLRRAAPSQVAQPGTSSEEGGCGRCRGTCRSISAVSRPRSSSIRAASWRPGQRHAQVQWTTARRRSPPEESRASRRRTRRGAPRSGGPPSTARHPRSRR